MVWRPMWRRPVLLGNRGWECRLVLVNLEPRQSKFRCLRRFLNAQMDNSFRCQGLRNYTFNQPFLNSQLFFIIDKIIHTVQIVAFFVG